MILIEIQDYPGVSHYNYNGLTDEEVILSIKKFEDVVRYLGFYLPNLIGAGICSCGRLVSSLSALKVLFSCYTFECLPVPNRIGVQFCYNKWSVMLPKDEIDKKLYLLNRLIIVKNEIVNIQNEIGMKKV